MASKRATPTKSTRSTSRNGRSVAKISASKNGSRGAINQSLGEEPVNRIDFARRAGLQYAGERDVYQVAGYLEVLHFDDYWDTYRRQDIAGAIVDKPVETTWRRGARIFEQDENEEEIEGSRFVEETDDLIKRMRLWNRLERADKLASVGRFGILLIGAPGDLDQPLPRLRGPQDVLFLQAYNEGQTRVTINSNVNDPRFGLPEMYQVNMAPDLVSGAIGLGNHPSSLTRLRNQNVHWTRVIHIAENLLSDDVFGIPRLQRVFNRLFDLEKIAASTGEAFWQLVAGILQGKIDPELEFEEADRKRLATELKEIYHDLRRTFYGQGVELEWLRTSAPQPEEAADLAMTLIAAAADIPKRILFGSETGERASTEDQKSWLGSISERQSQFAEPMILRAFIDRLVDHGGLSEPVSGAGNYFVEWPNLFEVPEGEIADANLKRAQAAKALTPVGGNPLEIVEVDEDRNVFLLPRSAADAEALEREGEDMIDEPGLPAEPDGATETDGDGAEET